MANLAVDFLIYSNTNPNVTIAKDKAEQLIREAHKQQDSELDADWLAKIEDFSAECARCGINTHVAFLATSILARAVDAEVDLHAIKPRHAKDGKKAYSARSLCHGVIVPLANELDMHIGVSGREPLNNQPYFRMRYLGDGTPVHAAGAKAFALMRDLIDELQKSNSSEAFEALRAFVAVRRDYRPSYEELTKARIAFDEAAHHLSEFIAINSENGKRAQSVVAALLDTAYDRSMVQTGRINDPSRKLPGDVRVMKDDGACFLAVEVRDKPVAVSDVTIFFKECIRKDASQSWVVALSSLQDQAVADWMSTFVEGQKLNLSFKTSVPTLFTECWSWSRKSKINFVDDLYINLHHRLIEMEASEDTISALNSMLSDRGD